MFIFLIFSYPRIRPFNSSHCIWEVILHCFLFVWNSFMFVDPKICWRFDLRAFKESYNQLRDKSFQCPDCESLGIQMCLFDVSFDGDLSFFKFCCSSNLGKMDLRRLFLHVVYNFHYCWLRRLHPF